MSHLPNLLHCVVFRPMRMKPGRQVYCSTVPSTGGPKGHEDTRPFSNDVHTRGHNNKHLLRWLRSVHVLLGKHFLTLGPTITLLPLQMYSIS